MQGIVTSDNHTGLFGIADVQITLKPIVSQIGGYASESTDTSKTINSYNTPINYAMLTGFMMPTSGTSYVYSFFVDHIAKTAHKLMLSCNSSGVVTKNLTYETYNSLITADAADAITFNLNSVKYTRTQMGYTYTGICVSSATTVVPNAVQYEFIKQPNVHYLNGVAFEPRYFGYYVNSVYHDTYGNSTGIWRYLEKAVTSHEVTINVTSSTVKYISIIYIERLDISLSNWIPVYRHKTYDLTTNKVYDEHVSANTNYIPYTDVYQFNGTNIDIQTNSITLKSIHSIDDMVYGFIVKRMVTSPA